MTHDRGEGTRHGLVRLLVFSSREIWSGSGAPLLSGRLKGLLETQKGVSVALSGGHTPAPFYRSLGDAVTAWPPAMKNRLQWFFSDERAVPPENDMNNFKMARAALVLPGDIPESTVHRIRGEDPIDRESRRYEILLETVLGHTGPHPPVLDIALLGLGPDGHTASLFPGSGPEGDHHRLVIPVEATDTRTARISLSYRMLAAAALRIFLVTGAEKRDILARILDPAGSLPAQILLKEAALHSLPTEFWIDEDALSPGLDRWAEIRKF